MSKVLIATLGTGRLTEEKRAKREYDPTEYRLNDFSLKTTFFAAFLQEYLKLDRIIFIGTAKSMWEEVYRFFCELNNKDFDENYYWDLAKWVEEANHQTKINEFDLTPVENAIGNGSKIILIKYGLNEEETWKNFNLIFGIVDDLNPGDDLYLDITHSFRSLSIFSFLVLNYLTTLEIKNVNLKGIYYGMADSYKEFNYAPVVDLAPLFKLTQWIQEAYNFINYGNGYGIANLLNEYNEKLSNSIKYFSDAINLNYLSAVKDWVDRISAENFDEIGDRVYPFKYIASFIINFIKGFSKIKKHSEFQIKLSEWFFDKKRYATGYIILHEAILTFLCELKGVDVFDEENRNSMKEFLRTVKKKCKNDFIPLADTYFSINKIRNNIAHHLPDRMNSLRNDIQNSQLYLEKVKSFFNNLKNIEF